MILSNKITIEPSDSHYNDILRYCKTELVTDNIDFQKKERMGLWTGNTPKKIHNYEIKGDNIILPFGCIDALGRNGWIDEYSSTDFAELHDMGWNFDLSLRDYQVKCVTAMVDAGHGIYISPAGSGKTQMFVDIILKLNKKALVLTHTQDLLTQAKDRIKSLTGINVGTITAGKVDIQDITVATVQTLSRMDLSLYQYEWGTVITDEVHRLFGSPTRQAMFYKVLSALKCRNKISCTATYHRADGQEKQIEFVAGEVKHVVTKDDVGGNVIPAIVKQIRTDYNINGKNYLYSPDGGTIMFSKLITDLTQDERRNAQIVAKLRELSGRHTLIVSDRTEHLQVLCGQVENGVYIDGKTKKVVREKAIQDMRDGKVNYLFGTWKLVKEGVDIPIIDNIVFASPNKDYAVVTQCVGRGQRPSQGKTECTVWDYCDTDCGFLLNMMYNRNRVYKKNGILREMVPSWH